MKFASAICAGVLLLAGSAAAQEGGKVIQKTTITLGTATPGGGFPLYGNAFAQAMNESDGSLSIEPRNTKGSNENIPLLEKGELDIALVAGEPSYEAFMGIGRPATHIRSVPPASKRIFTSRKASRDCGKKASGRATTSTNRAASRAIGRRASTGRLSD